MSAADSLRKLNEMDLSDIDLDINKAGQWPIVVKLITWSIIAALIFGGYYHLKIKDQIASLEREQAKEQSLRTEFRALSAKVSSLDAYKLQLKDMRDRFGELVKQLPSKVQIPGLLDDVAEKVGESGLALDAMNIRNEIPQDFYIEQPVGMSMSGSYHDFGSFVSGVAALPRIVTLHDFTITRGASGDDLSLSLTAKTYRYKEDQEGNE